ncbi:MAG: flagellar biosynthetic protein FliO [Pseudomonadota bacterium]
MELADYSRFVFALIFVVGLIWLVAYIAKRTGLDKRMRGVTGQRGRLAVVDVLYLDPKRKLTLVRADNREYVLLISGDRAQLIDTLDAKENDPTA